MNCFRNDVVLLPIPFTDLSSRKVRPAVVIGFGSFPGDLFVVPLTSRLANAEFTLAGWQHAGLNVPTGIKAQLATVESALVLKIIGRLSSTDCSVLDIHLRRWLGL
jgi:mRNA interferase MazF